MSSLTNQRNVMAFRERLQRIRHSFNELDPIERVIVAHSLFYEIPSPNYCFLRHALEERAQKDPKAVKMETEANDLDYVGSLSAMPEDRAIARLLEYLPLLRTGNIAVANSYVSVLEAVCAHSLSSGLCRNDCMQLLSLALIHPAIPMPSRDLFIQWREKLSDPRNPAVPGLVPVPLPSYVSGANSGPIAPGQGPVRGQRATGNSLVHVDLYHPPPMPGMRPPRFTSTPQMLAVPHAATADNHQTVRSSSMVAGDLAHRIDDNKDRADMLRSQSLPMAMKNGAPSPRSVEPRSGMKEVPSWLKGLRLHKYQDLFAEMTYDEMMALTDETLSLKGVTKGARHKILTSIRKLHQRADALRGLYPLLPANKLLTVAEEIRNVLATPIRPSAPVAARVSPDMQPSDNARTAGSVGRQSPDPPVPRSASAAGMLASSMVPVPTLYRHESEPGPVSASAAESSVVLDARAGARISTSSHSSMSSASSASDIGPSPSPTNGLERDDLPALILDLFGKACAQLKAVGGEEDTCITFLSTVDKAMLVEAFSLDDRHTLFSLKQMCVDAAKDAQRRVMESRERFMSSQWTMQPAVAGAGGFQAPQRLSNMPMHGPQPMSRPLPPMAPPAPAQAAAAQAAADAATNSSASRRRLERQNARQNTNQASGAASIPVLPIGAPVQPPLQMVGGANPFGAPGSGRRQATGALCITDDGLEPPNGRWARDYSTPTMSLQVNGNTAGAPASPPLLTDPMHPGQGRHLMSNGMSHSVVNSASDLHMEHLCRSMTEHALDEKSERDQS